MKHILFILMLLSSSIFINAQVPEAFNYQAVIRNSSGEVVSNQQVKFRISILTGSETGTTVYSETHTKVTNDFGLANLKIGMGNNKTGIFSPGGWGIKSHFIKIELDENGGDAFRHFGTSQLLAVPYAFHAQTVEDDNVNDADADPENEIQSLSINGSNLSITDGNTIILPLGEGGDNWGSQIVESNATLTGQGTSSNPLGVVSGEINPDWGNIQNVPEGFDDNVDNTEDDDADPENELQTLSIDGNNLTLSDGGGTVELPSSGNSSLWQQNGNDIYYNFGNVGIGVTPENTKLHVKANSSVGQPHLLLEEDEADYARLTFKNTANPSKYWAWAGNCDDNNNNSRMNLWYYNGTSGKDLLSISGNGNLGIGTLNPRSNLEIASSDIPQIRLNNTSTGVQNVQKITFWKGTTEKFAIGFDLWGTGDDLFTLYDTPNLTPVFNIKSSNVGIGTTSPLAKLHIRTETGSGLAIVGKSYASMSLSSEEGNIDFRVQRPSQSNFSTITFSTGGQNHYAMGLMGTNDFSIYIPSLGKAFELQPDGDVSLPGNLLVPSGKRLGIGTTSPDVALHVHDRIRIRKDPSYGSLYGELYHNGGGNGFCINANAGGGWADMHLQTDGTTRLFIESGGNVGIGTTSPSKRLYVNGSAGGTQAWNASDKRYKKNIKTLQNSLDGILQLRGVQYEWKYQSENESTGFDNKIHYGIIAQELEKVFPYLVDNPGETEEMKHVEYNGLIGILIESTKELKAENDKLKNRLKKLESQYKELQSHILLSKNN